MVFGAYWNIDLIRHLMESPGLRGNRGFFFLSRSLPGHHPTAADQSAQDILRCVKRH